MKLRAPLRTPPATLDLKGLKCPLPALRTQKALRAMRPGEAVAVLCTDPLAGIDIPNLLNQTGDALECVEEDGDAVVFHIRKLQPRRTP